MQLADNGREGEHTTPIGRLLEPRRPFHHPLTPLQIVHAAQDWTGLQDTLLLLSKRRSQLRQVITAIVRQVMGYVDDTPDLQTKTALIKTLQDLTEGKVSDWIGCEPKWSQPGRLGHEERSLGMQQLVERVLWVGGAHCSPRRPFHPCTDCTGPPLHRYLAHPSHSTRMKTPSDVRGDRARPADPTPRPDD